MDAINSRRNYIVLFGGLLIALLFYPVASYLVFYYQKDSLVTMFCHQLILWVVILILYFYALRVEGRSFLLWPEQPYKVLFYIISIVVLYLLGFAGNAIGNIPKWLRWHEIWNRPVSNSLFKLIISWYHQNLALIAIDILSWSVFYELIFRGYLLPRLTLVFKNKVLAIILSSILFTLFPYGRYSLRNLIISFITGIIFATYYQKYRNIKVLIIARFLLDFTLMWFLRQMFLRW